MNTYRHFIPLTCTTHISFPATVHTLAHTLSLMKMSVCRCMTTQRHFLAAVCALQPDVLWHNQILLFQHCSNAL